MQFLCTQKYDVAIHVKFTRKICMIRSAYWIPNDTFWPFLAIASLIRRPPTALSIDLERYSSFSTNGHGQTLKFPCVGHVVGSRSHGLCGDRRRSHNSTFLVALRVRERSQMRLIKYYLPVYYHR